MIEGLKSYPQYKDSGHTWLPRVPQDWLMLPNRALFAEVNERNHPNEEMLSVTITQGVIRQKSLLAETSKKDSSNLDKSTYKLVCPRDVVYNKMRAWQGAIGVSEFRGIVSPAYIVMRLRNKSNLPRYFHHLYRTPHFAKEAERWSYGITSDMWSLRPEHFKMIYSPHPPHDEQNAIVRFLDHATGRIECAIGAKKKLITLLNEQKQVIIHRAATRGLEPGVQLKSSGIPWLGDIPEHWEVMSLRMRYTVELGKMLDAKRITGRYSMPYLRNRDVQWDRILVNDLPTMDIPPDEFPRYTVKRGDLLVCEGGEVGRCAFWEDQLPTCGYQKALHRIRGLNLEHDFPRFFFYQMHAVSKQGIFGADGNENTIAHLTCEKLRRHRFVFPPFDEQKQIADYLDTQLKQYQNTVTQAESEITLLREYRTRLVADVVTGKLDVREAASKLPAKVEELGAMCATNEVDHDAEPEVLGEEDEVEE